MPASKDGDPAAREEFEQVSELHRHVRRLQEGAPLLLRTAVPGCSGRDDLEICTFWISKDLKTLKWRGEEGRGPERELALGEILAVEEEDDAGDGASDGVIEENKCALKLTLQSENLPKLMGLLCASPEDLTSWRDGLKFLVGALPPPSRSGSGKRPDFMADTVSAKGASAAASAERREQQLIEANNKHQAENKELRDMIERKDETIAVLLRDLQNRNTVVDRCNKTESTSRESDEHLRDREVAILQRKIRRLQSELKAKRQTVKDLLSLLGKVTSQQGCESSAGEEDVEDENNDAKDEEDGVAELLLRRLVSSPAAGFRGAGREVGSGVGSAPRSRGIGADADADAEGAKEELKPLQAELSVLQSDMLGLRFTPPDRSAAVGSVGREVRSSGTAKSHAAGEGARQSPTAAMTAAPTPSRAKTPQAEHEAQHHPSVLAAATPSVETQSSSPSALVTCGKGAAILPSAAALEILTREMTLLEDKKRVVERLAQSLEPLSDGENEEDDGFPLR